jgi:hypothetical protein
MNVDITFQKIENVYSKEITYFKNFDLILFHSSYFNLNLIKKLKTNRIPFVIDFDDYWNLPTYHYLYKDRQKNNTLYLKKQLLEIGESFTL